MRKSNFFQFPLSERTNCNLHSPHLQCALCLLSVSSIGTNELQHRTMLAQLGKEIAFSFLYRNERTATAFATAHVFFNEVFQFPLSERTNCNRLRMPSQRDVQALSVSSIGTNELQPFDGSASRGPAVRFQFPLSERTNCNHAAAPLRPRRAHLSVSSIGTNELQPPTISSKSATRTPFQFPLSERTNCNFGNLSGVKSLVAAFSFLYRNERTATSPVR